MTKVILSLHLYCNYDNPLFFAIAFIGQSLWFFFLKKVMIVEGDPTVQKLEICISSDEGYCNCKSLHKGRSSPPTRTTKIRDVCSSPGIR